MAEVRPWVGSYVSVGQFKTLRDIVLVDCSVNHARGFTIYIEEPEPAERERSVWADIDKAFCEPVGENDSGADYAPTQILAETFRRQGYDGIAYKSGLGKGYNVALFDINAADLVNRFLYEVKCVAFRFKEAGNS